MTGCEGWPARAKREDCSALPRHSAASGRHLQRQGDQSRALCAKNPARACEEIVLQSNHCNQTKTAVIEPCPVWWGPPPWTLTVSGSACDESTHHRGRCGGGWRQGPASGSLPRRLPLFPCIARAEALEAIKAAVLVDVRNSALTQLSIAAAAVALFYYSIAEEQTPSATGLLFFGLLRASTAMMGMGVICATTIRRASKRVRACCARPRPLFGHAFCGLLNALLSAPPIAQSNVAAGRAEGAAVTIGAAIGSPAFQKAKLEEKL